MNMGVFVGQHYHVECFDKYGALKWTEDFDNLVVTQGCVRYLNMTLSAGAVSPTWYVGLKGTGTPAVGDTMASHGSWADMSLYTGTRPAWTPTTWNVVSAAVTNSASVAAFAITTAGTVYGAFLTDSSTLTGTTGNLLGVGDFTGGNRAVIIGDTLNVTVTCTMSG